MPTAPGEGFIGQANRNRRGRFEANIGLEISPLVSVGLVTRLVIDAACRPHAKVMQRRRPNPASTVFSAGLSLHSSGWAESSILDLSVTVTLQVCVATVGECSVAAVL